MTKSASADPAVTTSLSTADLALYAGGWLLDGEIRQLSPATLFFRRLLLDKLLWFLAEKSLARVLRQSELWQFLAYVSSGHAAEGGRWGNTQQTCPIRPATVRTYFGGLRTVCNWLIAEGALTASPLETLTAPISHTDQVQPFTGNQVDAYGRLPMAYGHSLPQAN